MSREVELSSDAPCQRTGGLVGRSQGCRDLVMNPLVLALRDRPDQRLDLSRLTPDLLAGLSAADIARIELNLYLRQITTTIIFLVTLGAVGIASEAIVGERARETWDSLIATPLTARDILRSKMLAAFWRLRVILATLVALWTIGLVAGAIHPAGYVVSLLVVAAWTWLMLVFGMSLSVAAKDMAASTNPTVGLVYLTTGTVAPQTARAPGSRRVASISASRSVPWRTGSII